MRYGGQGRVNTSLELSAIRSCVANGDEVIREGIFRKI
jgi:hypothetical protein